MMSNKSLIKMDGITKSFPGVVANDAVDFDLRVGEIHSVLGENGAGKTTLMKILAGMYQPDEGTIRVHDRTIPIRSPQDSLKLGIGMVYQHFTLIPNLTVLENLILGFEGGICLDLKKANQKLQKISNAYGLSVDPQRKIQELSLGERQQTEILKILFHESDVLILDEPASVLSPAEAKNLYYTLNLLRDVGKSVILITHNISEALAVSDRITIMRSGKIAAELSGGSLRAMNAKAASEKMLNFMFGAIPEPATTEVETVSNADPLLIIKNIEVLNNMGRIGLKRISFSLREGEIIGLTGVGGQDQRLLAEAIAGQKQIRFGSLHYRGRDITRMKIAERFDLGISYITANRIDEGCVPTLSLSENLILQNYYKPPFSRFGILNQAQIHSFSVGLIKRFGIRAFSPEATVSMLSGGNIQKLLLARGLSGRPGLIICNNPTYGLDAKTVRFIQDLLKVESRRGTAVLLFTSDMDELFSCSNRIGVLFNGELAGLMDRSDATTEKIGRLMLGVNE